MGKTEGLCAGALMFLETCLAPDLKKSEYFSTHLIAFFD
jgi:hypothetical protein